PAKPAPITAPVSTPQTPVQAPAQTVAPAKPAAVPTVSPALNGQRFYRKCIACHQKDGAGIPGSFPSLNQAIDVLAASDAGRTYLVSVVNNGLRGDLKTKRGNFKGIMVRQAGGKSAEDVADLLNYILDDFYDNSSVKKFTGQEVQTIMETQGRMSGDKVLALRPVDG
ncbi:MAG TPA: c-type cytochrome, partial [Hellea balneolensis]|nr:c-type cytochrome [Hellea balneolensis]